MTGVLHTSALNYAARGIRVFPLRPRGKDPITPHGWKNATTSKAQIDKWWTETPDANIGIPTGLVTGWTVVDEDTKPWEDKTGDKSMAELIELYGPLPATLKQQTWSKSVQYIFAYNPEGVTSAHSYGEYIDGRNDGGYICVPPSFVEEDGRHGTYAWVNELEPAPMPEWLALRARTGPHTPESEKKAGGTVGRDGRRRNAPGWADDLIGGVGEGSRDDTCIRLIGRYSQMRPPLSRGEVERVMLAWAAECVPPFPESTVLEKIDRLFKIMEAGLIDLPMTDPGNAERMVLLHGDRFRWAVDRRTWLAWDGRRWAEGSEDKVRALALNTMRQTQVAIARMESEATKAGVKKDALMSFAIHSEDRRRIDNAVSMAKILPGVVVEDKALDQHPMLLNTLSGTVDLATGTVHPHNPEDYLTQLCPVEYNQEAQAPTWERFLKDIFLGKDDVIAYVQRAIGYSVTGSTAEQCLFFEHGAGDNGKSTMIEAVAGTLGDDYATPADKEAVLYAEKNKGRGAAPELTMLRGKRLAYISENDDDRQLDEGRIKSLTGSRATPARDLYKSHDVFANVTKIWFDLNTLPQFKSVDGGTSRRPRVIPFDYTVPPEAKDRFLPEKLKAEAPGILAWIVAGAVAWARIGLQAPEEVEYATRSYIDENNHLPRFFEETYEKSPASEIPSSRVQADYALWCEQRDETRYHYAKKVVKYMKGVMKLRQTRDTNERKWLGIRSRGL